MTSSLTFVGVQIYYVAIKLSNPSIDRAELKLFSAAYIQSSIVQAVITHSGISDSLQYSAHELLSYIFVFKYIRYEVTWINIRKVVNPVWELLFF